MDRNSFVRNLYSDGMLLDASDFENQQEYQNSKRKMINRSLLGFGVAYGFIVTHAGSNLQISAGFALDASGQELFLPCDKTVALFGLLPVSGSGEGNWHLCAGVDEIPSGEACVLPNAGGSHTVCPNRMEERCRFWLTRAPGQELCIAHLRLSSTDKAGTMRIEALESPVNRFSPAIQKNERQASSTGCLTLRAGNWSGETLYSRELSHGLGPGSVSVTLAVEGEDGTVSGDYRLFGVPVRTAVRLFPERGSFVAAVRTLRPVNALRLRWYAQRPDFERRETPAPEKHGILTGLDPPFAVLRPLEKLKFTPVYSDERQNAASGCLFCLESPGDGKISGDGVYTAPDRDGLFRVTAKDAADLSQLVTALVVVRR